VFDASWKCKKIPGNAGLVATGIGVFIQYTADGQSFNIMVRASVPLVLLVL
jgi:hypothetical protein